MRSTIGIDITAPADLVFNLACDVERWPDLLPHYVRATRRAGPDADGRLAIAFVARRPLVPVLGLAMPVAWRSLAWAEPAARRLRFLHSGGATNGMDVTWRIDETAPGRSHVEIEHVFRPRLPGWAGFVDRLFTRPIAGRTLATFRAIAEAIAATDAADQSGDAAPTNSTT